MTQCNPSPEFFSATLKILGPFGTSDGTITYQRSVSSHKYMKLKFFILKMGWASKDSLSIIITNQDNTLLSNQTLTYLSQIPKETLCS